MAYLERVKTKCGICGGRGCYNCVPRIRPLPPLPPSHDIGAGGNFYVIEPAEVTNQVVNPMPEHFVGGTGGENWLIFGIGNAAPSFFMGGTHGPWSFGAQASANPADGIHIQSGITLSVLQPGKYTLCVDVEGEIGKSFEIYLAPSSNSFTRLTTKTVTLTTSPQRICVTHLQQTAQQVDVVVRKGYPNYTKLPWKFSSIQLEPGREGSTFIQGFGPYDWYGVTGGDFGGLDFFYRWEGGIYRSYSSRGRFTRSGGFERSLESCGFQVTGYGGLGMVDPSNVSQPYASIDGSYYQGTRYDETVFTITGRFTARCLADLHKQRSCLVKLLSDTSVLYRDLIILRYYPTDDCGNPCGFPVDMVGRYTSGMGGDISGGLGEDVTLSFTMFSPFVTSYYQNDYAVVVAPDSAPTTPNATGDMLLKVAVCSRGDVHSSPVFIFQGDYEIESIVNDDSGETIAFQTPYDLGSGWTPGSSDSEFVIVNTVPQSSQVASTTEGNLSGLLEACSSLATMTIPGGCNWTHYSIQFRNVTNPPFNPFGSDLVTPRNTFRIVYKERWSGIDAAAGCPAGNCCDPDDVRAGYTPLYSKFA